MFDLQLFVRLKEHLTLSCRKAAHFSFFVIKLSLGAPRQTLNALLRESSACLSSCWSIYALQYSGLFFIPWIGTKQDKNRLQRTVRSGAASTAAAWTELLPSCRCSRALRTPGFKYPSYMMCASKRTIYSPNHLSLSLQMPVSCCFGQCGQCGLRAQLVIKLNLILSAATEQARSFLWVKSDWLSGALQTLHVCSVVLPVIHCFCCT